MALIECPECEGKVSDKAETCPHCGFNIKDYIKRSHELIFCPKCGSSPGFHSNGVCCICETKVVNTHKRISYKYDNVEKRKSEVFDELKLKGLYDPEYHKIVKMINNAILSLNPTDEERSIREEYEKKTREMRERDGYYDKKPEPRPTPEKIIIKCPNCGSTDTKRVTATSRMAGVLTLGLASSSIGKQYMCKRCKYKW